MNGISPHTYSFLTYTDPGGSGITALSHSL